MLPHQQTLSQTHPRPSALRRAGPTTEPPTFHDSIVFMTIANEILLNGETLRFEHGGNVVAYALESKSCVSRKHRGSTRAQARDWSAAFQNMT